MQCFVFRAEVCLIRGISRFGIIIIQDPNLNPDLTSLKKKVADLSYFGFQIIQIACNCIGLPDHWCVIVKIKNKI